MDSRRIASIDGLRTLAVAAACAAMAVGSFHWIEDPASHVIRAWLLSPRVREGHTTSGYEPESGSPGPLAPT